MRSKGKQKLPSKSKDKRTVGLSRKYLKSEENRTRTPFIIWFPLHLSAFRLNRPRDDENRKWWAEAIRFAYTAHMFCITHPLDPITLFLWINKHFLHVDFNLYSFCRLCCTDGSEFLFLAGSEAEMEDWVNKISFHAKLPPSLQLLSYDESQKVRVIYFW